MPKGIRNKYTGLIDAGWECWEPDCPYNDGEVRFARNAMGTAAQHAAATGHYVHATSTVGVSYNKPEKS